MHTRWAVRGWGVNILEDARHYLRSFIFTYDFIDMDKTLLVKRDHFLSVDVLLGSCVVGKGLPHGVLPLFERFLLAAI